MRKRTFYSSIFIYNPLNTWNSNTWILLKGIISYFYYNIRLVHVKTHVVEKSPTRVLDACVGL